MERVITLLDGPHKCKPPTAYGLDLMAEDGVDFFFPARSADIPPSRQLAIMVAAIISDTTGERTTYADILRVMPTDAERFVAIDDAVGELLKAAGIAVGEGGGDDALPPTESA